MTDSNLPDGEQAGDRPSAKQAAWPWAQIGVLTANVGLFITSLAGLLLLMEIDFRESSSSLAGLLLLVGLAVYGFSPKHRRGQETVPYSPKMRWINWGCFAASVLMTMLSGIVPAIHSARRAAQQIEAKNAEENPATWETVRSDKSSVLVQIPPHWVESTDPALAIDDVARIDEVNDLHFLLLSVPKEDVTYADLSAWSDAVLNELKSSLVESQVVEKTTHERQGRTEIELHLNYVSETTRCTVLMRFLETPRHYVWARVAATRSGFREHEEALRRMIQSVRSE